MDYDCVKSGTVSWRHSRQGDIGTRTITSSPITIDKSGIYDSSIWTKTSLADANSHITFLVSGMPFEQADFETSWIETADVIELIPGEYELEILIEDNTAQPVDIYFDNVKLGFVVQDKPLQFEIVK